MPSRPQPHASAVATDDAGLATSELAALKSTSISSTKKPETNVPCDRAYVGRIDETLDVVEAALQDAATLDGTLGSSTTRPSTRLSVSIVIPVYNERETIIEIVERVLSLGIHDEIVIVDDYSVDGTRDILVGMSAAPDVTVLMHGYNRGKGAALRTGFEHVHGDVVMIQDADLEYDPRDLPQLLGPIERGEADVVYGSRFLRDAHQDPSRFHRFGNWLLTAASNWMTGQHLTDMETCYKAFRRSVLEQIDLEQERFGFEPEITAKVSRLGYRIVELPIGYNSRGYDEGKKIGVRDALNAFWCIAKYR